MIFNKYSIVEPLLNLFIDNIFDASHLVEPLLWYFKTYLVILRFAKLIVAKEHAEGLACYDVAEPE